MKGILDRLMSRVMYGTVYFLIVFTLVYTGTALAEYRLDVWAASSDGTQDYIAGNVSDDAASCNYNMGVIVGTWYESELIASVSTPYTVDGTSSYMEFNGHEDENGIVWTITVACTPVIDRT